MAVVVLGAALSACANRTNDAEPVLQSSAVPGLAAEAAAGTEAWVCTGGDDTAPGAAVTAVDLPTLRVRARVTTGALPAALAATPDGRYLVVADEGEDLAALVDTATGTVTRTFTTGEEPDAVAVSPDGRLALVADADSASVTVVSLVSMRVVRTVRVGPQPDAVAVSPVGGSGDGLALVADLGNATVTPIDLRTLSPGPPIPVGDEPDAVAVLPGADVAMVADLGANELTPIQLSPLRVGAPIALPLDPTGVVGGVSVPGPVGPEPAALVSGGEALVVVDAATRTVTRRYAVGRLAEAVAVADGGTEAVVADQGPFLTDLDLTSGKVVGSVDVGGVPTAVVVPPPRR